MANDASIKMAQISFTWDGNASENHYDFYKGKILSVDIGCGIDYLDRYDKLLNKQSYYGIQILRIQNNDSSFYYRIYFFNYIPFQNVQGLNIWYIK